MARPKKFDPDAAVDAAMELFWRKGFAQTTPQDLVEELQIGKGSLYGTFGSKLALFELALRRYRENQNQALGELLGAPGTVRDRIRSMLAVLVATDVADPDRRGCLAVNTAASMGGHNESAATVREMFDNAEEIFLTLVAEGQASGELRSDQDALTVASLLLSTVVSIRVMSRVDEGPERLMRVVDAVIDSI